jgi:hypothetical protein
MSVRIQGFYITSKRNCNARLPAGILPASSRRRSGDESYSLKARHSPAYLSLHWSIHTACRRQIDIYHRCGKQPYRPPWPWWKRFSKVNLDKARNWKNDDWPPTPLLTYRCVRNLSIRSLPHRVCRRNKYINVALICPRPGKDVPEAPKPKKEGKWTVEVEMLM